MTIETGSARRCDSAITSASEIVRRFHVHYEVYPETVALRDHSIRNVGYRLELYGRVAPGVRPGDGAFREVCRELLDLSSFIVAGAKSGCLCEVGVSPAALYFSGSQERAQACVRLDIRIFHGEGCERPIDPMQERALHDMEERLGALGVSRGPGA
jgi:hypothetical protein